MNRPLEVMKTKEQLCSEDRFDRQEKGGLGVSVWVFLELLGAISLEDSRPKTLLSGLPYSED